VYLDFADAIRRDGEATIRAKYGNLFDMYAQITGENPYQSPMRIYPAVHYTMGGLWVDYNLHSNLKGLYVLGEANFSDHGANRLGASALMQGLADGYFVIPYTIADHLATSKHAKVTTDHPEVKGALVEARNHTEKLLGINGRRSVDQFHRELGKIMWNHVGMARNAQGLSQALDQIRGLRAEFWEDVKVLGQGDSFNQMLEHAGRVADFMEFAELLTLDALNRDESCGGHFREEHQTPDGECLRNDQDFCYVAAWEHRGVGEQPTLHKEPLTFEEVHLATRDYKN
jgi:succinate dehydrogenase / fumarate reductase, flavoprotein subunit